MPGRTEVALGTRTAWLLPVKPAIACVRYTDVGGGACSDKNSGILPSILSNSCLSMTSRPVKIMNIGQTWHASKIKVKPIILCRPVHPKSYLTHNRWWPLKFSNPPCCCPTSCTWDQRRSWRYWLHASVSWCCTSVGWDESEVIVLGLPHDAYAWWIVSLWYKPEHGQISCTSLVKWLGPLGASVCQWLHDKTLKSNGRTKFRILNPMVAKTRSKTEAFNVLDQKITDALQGYPVHIAKCPGGWECRGDALLSI